MSKRNVKKIGTVKRNRAVYRIPKRGINSIRRLPTTVRIVTMKLNITTQTGIIIEIMEVDI